MMNYLKATDESVFSCIEKEKIRQYSTLEMIASENFVSPAVLGAIGTILTNKYAEGYPGARYYNGCEFVDEIENLTIERAKKLFGCEFANVQTHSGSQANQAVFLAFLKPGDTFMGLDLAAGGHLTHGCKVNQSGKWFNVVSYGVDQKTSLIQFDEVRKLALQHKPKLIIAGGSAYPRIINFQAFREIADEIGAYLMVDMAHFAGLVAGKVHDSPFPYAHIVTSTTHKTLRGARGGLILTNDPGIAKKINSAVFPGLQGGPLMNHIAGKAVAFYEALQPKYKEYTQQIVKNARALARLLHQEGIGLVSGGTDTHLILIDLRSCSLTGNEVADSLHRAGITCNKNGIPFDPQPPKITSGVRLGTPALTTRGMKEHDMEIVSSFIMEVIRGAQAGRSEEVECKVRTKVEDFCKNFPLHAQ